MNTEDLGVIPRKDLHIFYIMDTSASMEGDKISTLNHALEECQEVLEHEAKKNGDANLKIAVMEFNSNPEWITKFGPEDVEDFEFEYLTTGGMTNIGAALNELNSKLDSNGFLKSMTGALMPIFIFMTDGWSTDDENVYKNALASIRNNKWYRRGTKIGFALGDDADLAMISEVVGSHEAVIQTSDLEVFQKLLRFVSVTSSMVSSKPSSDTGEKTGSSIVKAAVEENPEITENITINIDPNSYDGEEFGEWDEDEEDWEE